MADLETIAGSRIFIGGALAPQATDFVAGDFAGESWTEIDGWETLGELGDNAEIIVTALINRGRDVKQKGTRNAGQMQNRFSVLPGDAGQDAVRAAEQTKDSYAFKIEKPLRAGETTPRTRFFVAMVGGVPEPGGQANTVEFINTNFEVNSNVVEQAAT